MSRESKEEREKRLAGELRKNLRRRKAPEKPHKSGDDRGSET